MRWSVVLLLVGCSSPESPGVTADRSDEERPGRADAGAAQRAPTEAQPVSEPEPSPEPESELGMGGAPTTTPVVEPTSEPTTEPEPETIEPPAEPMVPPVEPEPVASVEPEPVEPEPAPVPTTEPTAVVEPAPEPAPQPVEEPWCGEFTAPGVTHTCETCSGLVTEKDATECEITIPMLWPLYSTAGSDDSFQVASTVDRNLELSDVTVSEVAFVLVPGTDMPCYALADGALDVAGSIVLVDGTLTSALKFSISTDSGSVTAVDDREGYRAGSVWGFSCNTSGSPSAFVWVTVRMSSPTSRCDEVSVRLNGNLQAGCSAAASRGLTPP